MVTGFDHLGRMGVDTSDAVSRGNHFPGTVRIFALSPETLPSESLCKRLRAAFDACPMNRV
jgi:hypothetical protein